jgi:aldehyde dehydrogenase (NAD+)
MVPEFIPNYIGGKMCAALSGKQLDKYNPHSGQVLTRCARSDASDMAAAIASARSAQASWQHMTAVARGDLMRDIALRMREKADEIAAIVAAETGKSFGQAMGETQAAIEMGFFVAGEGRRNYGRTTTASMANRTVMTIRQPVGLAALIIAANTPIANVAWKAFPAMFCGNVSIMKPSEDTPATAWIFARICDEVGIPAGVFNVVQGVGREAGSALVDAPEVDLISFTGSCETGRAIQKVAAPRLKKTCMELGGKNALVVCDDADLELAVNWVIQSAFSNAGQRCAAASRIVVFDKIYQAFRERLLEATVRLRLGPTDEDFTGPVINEASLVRILQAVREAKEQGATILCGGGRSNAPEHPGYYVLPTILENVQPNWPISQNELFGPVTVLYRVGDFHEALALVNDSRYGLTASIHTASVHRAMRFAEEAQAGVVVVNGGTHGSEPHMGFGGVKDSGTGWREAGTEALDVYSEWKYVNLITDPKKA